MQSAAMSVKQQLIDNREEATIICAALALHGMLAGGTAGPMNRMELVTESFALAAEFLRQAGALKP
jgi:hypothetical protein